MAYTYSISISIGSSRAGLLLAAQLYDILGTNVGSEITTGFAEIGQGNYLWTYTEFPTGFRGGVKFYSLADVSKILAATSINPEDAEQVGKIEQTVKSPQNIEIQTSNNASVITVNPGHTGRGVNLQPGVR